MTTIRRAEQHREQRRQRSSPSYLVPLQARELQIDPSLRTAGELVGKRDPDAIHISSAA